MPAVSFQYLNHRKEVRYKAKVKLEFEKAKVFLEVSKKKKKCQFSVVLLKKFEYIFSGRFSGTKNLNL